MTLCTCSMSSLHVNSARPCCPSSQLGPGRGVILPGWLGGLSDSAVVILKTSSRRSSVNSKSKFGQTGGSDSFSRLRKWSSRESGVSVGLEDSRKTVPRRNPAVEALYRVEDAVDSGALTEDDIDYTRRRNRDRNRKQQRYGSERRRRVQIFGNNGLVDLEEHLGMITDDEVVSRERYRSKDSRGKAVQRVASLIDEEGRRLLESSLLNNGTGEMQVGHESSDGSSSPPQSRRLERDLYPESTQAVRSAGFSEDVIEVEVAEEGSGVNLGSKGDVRHAWDKDGLQGPRSLAEFSGGRRVVELVAAWDGLAGRLPLDFSRSSGSDLLLRALKLTVMALQHTSPDDNGRTPLCQALAVAHTLADLGMDAEVISTGLLREAVESELVSYSIVEESLGGNIARLLRDCARVRHIPSRMETLDDDNARALRQFCLAFHDICAVVVELACQLDTMKHIHSIPRYRQQMLALETMQIYAPLAHAIGTNSLALELEDLGFRVLFPDSYSYIESWLRSHWIDGSLVVDEFKEQLEVRLKQDFELQTLVATVNVTGRYKSKFSTMRKLLRDGRKPEEVYDVLGLRVILEPRADDDVIKQREQGLRACYRAFEVATSMWEEVPGRLKDYIAHRKENGYESLHFAVRASNENDGYPPMEIQIRTVEMDAAAVSGEASHALYKGGMTDPEQIRNLKLLMVAASNAAASRFREVAGAAVGLASRDRRYDDKDQMFEMFDKNQDGVISVEEFREVISELGADEGDALELMQIVDLNTDGFVSAEEFGKFRHQIQISQNLAGFDRVFSSQLGSKLQESSESESGSWSPNFGKLPKDVTELIAEKLEDKLGSMTDAKMSSDQRLSSAPLDAVSEEVSTEGSVNSWKVNEVDTSKRLTDTNVWEDTDGTGSTMVEAPTASNGNDIDSKTSPLTRKLIPKLLKPVPTTGNLGSDVLQEIRATLPKLEEEIPKCASDLKATSFEELKAASNEDEVFANVIEQELLKIRQLAAEGNLGAARNLAVKLSKQYPGSTKALLHRASLERKSGNLKAAGALYSQAVEILELRTDLGIEYVRALQAWASLEGQIGNGKTARHLFSESVDASQKGDLESALRGAGVYGLHGWAMLEEKSGNWSEARDLLERAANLQPGNAVVHQSRASLEARVHNYAAARLHFNRGVEAAPEDVRCWHAWANFEGTRRNVQKMRQLFQRALKVDPKNLHSLQAWAYHEGLAGTCESRSRARKLYQKCIDINPKNMYCWQSWGVLEQEGGNFEGARVLFEQGLEVNGESVPCLQAYAHMERKCGNLGAALVLLQRALAVEPNNAASLMELALIKDMSGNSEAALDLYKQAARVDKQKSLVKRRTFESRNRERQGKDTLPKSEGLDHVWRRKSAKTDGEKGVPRLSNFSSDKLESQYERICTVAAPAPGEK